VNKKINEKIKKVKQVTFIPLAERLEKKSVLFFFLSALSLESINLNSFLVSFQTPGIWLNLSIYDQITSKKEISIPPQLLGKALTFFKDISPQESVKVVSKAGGAGMSVRKAIEGIIPFPTLLTGRKLDENQLVLLL
jgi:hypothetical protein